MNQEREWNEYLNHAKEVIHLCKSITKKWGEHIISLDYYIEKELLKERKNIFEEEYKEIKEIILWRYFINIMIKIEEIDKKNIISYDFTTETMRPSYCLFIDDISKSILFLFKGTSSINDIITDLNVSIQPFEDGHVHQGMYESAKWFDQKFKEKILKLKEKTNYSLKLIGHSLGSGVASILTILWKDIENIKCYSFGCPSVLSLNLSEKYSSFIISIINGDDIVPLLSLSSIDHLRKNVELFHQEYQIYNQFSNFRKIISYFLSNNEYNNNPFIELIDLSEKKDIPLFPCGTIYHIKNQNNFISIYKSFPHLYNEIIFTNNCKHDHNLSSYKSNLFNYILKK